MEFWSWESGSSRERGEIVRQHAQFPNGQIGRLFHLTEHGVERIMGGDDWRPAYERQE